MRTKNFNRQNFTNLSVDLIDIENYNSKVKFIKAIRDLMLFPFTIPFLLKKEGNHLYFQAKILYAN
jgi:hypothetical protein